MKSNLSESHFGYNGQHDLLSFAGVRVAHVLLQPVFQGACRLPSGVLATVFIRGETDVCWMGRLSLLV